MIAVSAPATGRVADRAASGVARWAQARQLAPVSVAGFSVGFAIIAGAWLTGSSGRDCAFGLTFLLACVLTARVARAMVGPRQIVVYAESRHSVGNVPAANFGPFPPTLVADWLIARLIGLGGLCVRR